MLFNNWSQGTGKRKGSTFSFLLFFLLVLLMPIEAVHSQEGEVDYSVQAILPDENQNPDVTYFDLLVEPSQEMILQMLINNHGDTDIEVEVSINDAATNTNGVIIYGGQEELDSSLENPLSELIEIEEDRVTVPAGESKQVNAYLTIPEENFDGLKVGGFRFQKLPEELSNEMEETNGNVQINNEYAYVIGLVLQENDTEVIPNLELKSIEPDLFNYRTAVKVNLQNPTPSIIRNLDITAEVFEADGEEPIHVASQESGRFAPNSNMNFYIDWNNQPLESGEYRLELIATDGENEWEWNENFAIQKEDKVEDLNEQAVELDTSSNLNQWLIIAIILLVIIILLLLIRQYNLSHKSE